MIVGFGQMMRVAMATRTKNILRLEVARGLGMVGPPPIRAQGQGCHIPAEHDANNWLAPHRAGRTSFDRDSHWQVTVT
jgi:hypothetical protein